MKNRLFILLWLGGCLIAQAQKKPNASYRYTIRPATSAIIVDGKPDEKAWQSTEIATDFWQIQPMDTSKSWLKSEVKMCYDDKNIYVLFINYNRKEGGKYVVESMRRDFNFGRNDNDLLFLDPFEDQTNGFSFGSNAMGGQWDGQMANGGAINLSWDNKWQSEVSYDQEKWVWEAAIPFKTLRYKEGVTEWGINFSRLDLKTNEKSSWAPVPRQFPSASLAYTGTLVWENPPPKPGANISLIPFTTFNRQRSYVPDRPGKSDGDIGLDAKVGLTSSLNLDLTLNPDFSQVEVDVQQTNLDRFELFFPERRQFFLENGDIFNDFGSNSIRPFFSRRIGLDAPIRYGGRISGKLNSNWRTGLMHMQTGESSTGTPGSHYSVMALQRKVFSRSYVSGIVVNRQTVGNQEMTNPIPDYNRTVGLEYNLASADNLWTGKAFIIKTFSPLSTSSNGIYAFRIERSTRKLIARLTGEHVGDGIQANEVGFVRRRDYSHLHPTFGYLFFPKSNRIVSHGPRLSLNYFFDKELTKEIEHTNVLSYNVSFFNRSELSVWTATDYVELFAPFDPTNYVREFIQGNTQHRWRAVGATYDSKPKSLFTYSTNVRYGGYFADGTRLNINGNIGYRFQPYASLSVSANYNHITFESDARLPEKLKNTAHDLWLVGSRLDVTLSNKVFFTNFLQYNNQSNNINLNTRFQWRYSPASDLFFVYTDNYFADSFKVRNRAIVLKLTYWWNV